jgi:catechol 2,3-dioxygenase-like lactoylglutathione lyase family enzyme
MRLDHLVLTVADVEASADWYARVLGMERVEFGEGRVALRFGEHKINLHRAGAEIAPHAARPLPGTADICLLASEPLVDVLARLERHGVPVEVGPVARDGAQGPLESVYVRDPDGNLVELSRPARGATPARAAVGVRIARPTDRLEACVRFYRDGLGLAELGGFDDHDGYTGVFLGLPGERLHLELTAHSDGSPGPAPTSDNLLVLYVPDRAAIAAALERLAALGHAPVAPENPYWNRVGAVTVEDPDGWRAVLVPQAWPG